MGYVMARTPVVLHPESEILLVPFAVDGSEQDTQLFLPIVYSELHTAAPCPFPPRELIESHQGVFQQKWVHSGYSVLVEPGVNPDHI